MKKILILLIFSFQLLKAENSENLLQKLSVVNSEWKKQTDVQSVLQTNISGNKTFNDWIAAHLMLVEKTLRARDVSQLSPSQKQNRFKLLDELNGYWKAGVFPVNDYLPYKNPVFIDRKGTHCAVGYLMMQSGHDALAQKIDANEKFAYVHEIKTAGVAAWASEHGFTIDELAWIQPGYLPSVVSHDLDGGLNGTVNAITADTVLQIVYVGGSFSQSISGVTCSNIAAWISGFAGWDWVALDNGVNGTVYALLLHNNKLYVGGEFTTAGSVAAKNVAVYDIAQGQWQAIGSLDSTVRAFAVYNNEIYAGGNFTGFVSKWNGNAWQDVTQGFLYGEGARTLEVWNNELVIGGNFELATGALRRHVATYNGTYMGMLGMGTLTPVNDFEFFDGKLFAACDSAAVCALATFDGTDWNVHLKDTVLLGLYFTGERVTSLAVEDTTLFVGGHFDCEVGGGISTLGNNLMAYQPNGYYGVYTYIDSGINAVCKTRDNIFYGGHFTTNLAGGITQARVLNHIANIGVNMSDYTSIAPINNEEIFSVFPNPASDFIRIEMSDDREVKQLQLCDVAGRIILSEEKISSSKNISVSNLPAGIYFVRALTKNGWSAARFVKELF